MLRPILQVGSKEQVSPAFKDTQSDPPSSKRLSLVPRPSDAVDKHDLSRSIEADYHDLMSIELDECATISVLSIEAHHNQLSTLSPHSPESNRGSQVGECAI